MENVSRSWISRSSYRLLCQRESVLTLTSKSHSKLINTLIWMVVYLYWRILRDGNLTGWRVFDLQLKALFSWISYWVLTLELCGFMFPIVFLLSSIWKYTYSYTAWKEDANVLVFFIWLLWLTWNSSYPSPQAVTLKWVTLTYFLFCFFFLCLGLCTVII